EARKWGMFTSAPTQACTPTLSTRTSVRPITSSGTRTSSDKPPVKSASTNGDTIAGGSRGTAAARPAGALPAVASWCFISPWSAGAGGERPVRIAGDVVPQRGHRLIDVGRLGELRGKCVTRAHVHVAAIVVDRHRRVAALAVVGDVLDEPAAGVGVQLRLEVRWGRRPVHLIVAAAHVGGRELHDAVAGLATLHFGDVPAVDRHRGDVRFLRGTPGDSELGAVARAPRRGKIG